MIADGGNSALRRARFAADGTVQVDTVSVAGLELPVGLALSQDGRLAIADYAGGALSLLTSTVRAKSRHRKYVRKVLRVHGV